MGIRGWVWAEEEEGDEGGDGGDWGYGTTTAAGAAAIGGEGDRGCEVGGFTKREGGVG